MIAAGKPGRYLFFVGEECGGIGSSAFVLDNPTFSANMVVSFDRRGTDDIITHQGGTETCSQAFANALGHALNKQPGFKYEPSDEGIYTDSKEFSAIVPECTNVSVGYYSEHTSHERQDLQHLLKLRDAVIAVDWFALPIDRTPVEDTPWWTTYPTSDIPFTTRTEVLDSLASINKIIAAPIITTLDLVTIREEIKIIEGYFV